MEPLKNAFSYPKARLIAEAVKRAHPAFSLPQFSKRLEVALEPLELEQRMRLIADRIEAGLPAHPPELFAILTEALAVDEGDPHGLRGFLVWPLTEIVARRGLGHFPESMAALCEMTNRFTGEFAIRPFLRKHRERTLKQLHAWCDHPDDPRLAKLARHACRTLLKSGHPGALEFHGYGSAKALELEVFALGKSRSCWAGSWTTGSSSAIPRDVPSR